MREHRDRISLDKCVEGHVYRLFSRNLAFGVFRRNEGRRNGPGFIGIRLKFGNRFLFEEYHWDTGEPYGTANPLEDLGPVPEGIELAATINLREKESGRPVAWDQTSSGKPLIASKPDGIMRPKGYYFLDSEEYLPDLTSSVESDSNIALFEYLDGYEKELPDDYDEVWVTARVKETYVEPYTEQRKEELEQAAERLVLREKEGRESLREASMSKQTKTQLRKMFGWEEDDG